VRQRFLNAGVRNVYSMFAGGSAVPKRGSLRSHDARVDVNVTTKPLSREGKLGGTDIAKQVSTATTARMPAGEAGITLMTNVVGHEVGHGTHAMPEYDKDAAPIGSMLHPNPAEAGSLMEPQVGGGDSDLQVGILSSEVREFSDEDAAKLQKTLNDPQE